METLKPQQTIKLSELTNNTLLYGVAEAKINHQGFYLFMQNGLQTKVIK